MKRIAFLAAAAMTFLVGCTVVSPVESLLAPPKLSEEQSEIYRALTSAVGNNIRLQYPKSGNYRSAFIIENIDDEQTDEAIVFYENVGDGYGDGNLRMNILDIIDGKWVSVYDHAGIGSGIDRILFATLGNSKRKSVIVGYNLLSEEKSFYVYVYGNGIVTSTYSDNYSSVFTADINRDNQTELVVIHENSDTAGKQAYINLVTDNNSSVYSSTEVAMNPQTSDYANIVSGYVSKNVPAVYIDSISGSQLSTEIIYCVNDALRNPLYVSSAGLLEETKRPLGYLSTDIDLDGIIEIPTQSYFPGYSQYSSEPYKVTNWNVLDNYSITKKYSSYYSLSDGYCFIIPGRWDGVVTAKADTKTNDIIFCKFRSDLSNSNEELLRITAVPNSERDKRLSSGYKLLKTKDNINYMFKKTSANPLEPLVLTDAEIINNFYIMA